MYRTTNFHSQAGPSVESEIGSKKSRRRLPFWI